ncbi:hypothetical protein B0H12DRAFT_1164147 [Mycena haematopus]|nr:hypothetical protein B0H12DRAFT_1164147 [Mycena haematopus]
MPHSPMLSISRHLLLISSVALGVAEHATRPARRLMPLKPQYNRLSSQSLVQRSMIISGLLVARQSCDPGYGLCSTGAVVPLAATAVHQAVCCCNSGQWCYVANICCLRTEHGCDNKGCCDIGDNCCDGGNCCSASDYCTVVDGRQGCCEIGKVCTGTSNQCDETGYVPCTNEDFCCPAGQTCFRDSNNNPGCESGGGGGGSGGSPTTTKTTTTTHQATTTKAATPPQTTATTTSSQTTVASGSTAPSSAPPPPPGSQNVVIDVSSDIDITWTGDWITVPSSCTPGSKAKAVSGNSTTTADGLMSFSFTGTRIYVSVASLNVQYIISLDGAETPSGTSAATPAPRNCTFGWMQTNLSVGTHFLGISIFGAVDVGRRDIESPWALELQNLVITEPSSSVTGQSSSTSTAKAGDDGNLSAASVNYVSWSWLLIFTAVMTIFSV